MSVKTLYANAHYWASLFGFQLQNNDQVPRVRLRKILNLYSTNDNFCERYLKVVLSFIVMNRFVLKMSFNADRLKSFRRSVIGLEIFNTMN